MTTRSAPRRHWRSDGTEPLPSGSEALEEPMAAFPSWFLRITCDRCGKVQMVKEAPARWRDRSLRPPRSGCQPPGTSPGARASIPDKSPYEQ